MTLRSMCFSNLYSILILAPICTSSSTSHSTLISAYTPFINTNHRCSVNIIHNFIFTLSLLGHLHHHLYSYCYLHHHMHLTSILGVYPKLLKLTLLHQSHKIYTWCGELTLVMVNNVFIQVT